MDRIFRITPVFSLILLLMLATSCESTGSDNLPKPNIIVFIADDVSAADLKVYGNPIDQTPVIDSLAQNGITFERAILTTSSCSPSRASIISGRYPHNTGAPELHTPLLPSIKTFAGDLKSSGYFTGASGKWHLGDAPRKDFNTVMDTAIGPGGEDRWLELLDSIPEQQPFFLWMASLDAHRNWDRQGHPAIPNADAIIPPPYLVNDSLTRHDLAAYHDEIARFDYHIGSVLNSLRNTGRLGNTLIIVIADNGRPFPRDKTRMYDSGLQTPLIVSWAGMANKPQRSRALISIIDLAPTLLQIAGLPVGESYQGMSFKSVLQNPAISHRDYVFAEHNWHDYQAHERMVRSQEYLLIENNLPEKRQSSAADVHTGDSFKSLLQWGLNPETVPAEYRDHFIYPRPQYELYHTIEDPYQLNNLAESPEYSAVLESLKQRLARWKKATADTPAVNLTPDHYDYYGNPLDSLKTFNSVDRGKLPGLDTGASKIVSNDSDLQE